MLPLETADHMQKATNALKDLEPEIQKFLKDRDFELCLKGCGVFFVAGTQDARVLYASLDTNEANSTLIGLTDMIIKKMLQDEVILENELGNIAYDESHDRYLVKFHLTLINSSTHRIGGQMLGFKGRNFASV